MHEAFVSMPSRGRRLEAREFLNGLERLPWCRKCNPDTTRDWVGLGGHRVEICGSSPYAHHSTIKHALAKGAPNDTRRNRDMGN